ncbi:hypothetical protein BDL97_11G047800 [Sphagnum fallax]|nr:hypothetical protein BDL97_11G047800 [Sphagnum fallax]
MDSQQTERRDGGCCDCASKQSTPAHLPRKMGSNARQSLRLRRVSLPLLARWRRPRSPLAGGGGGGQGAEGPARHTGKQKRQKGQTAAHKGRQERVKRAASRAWGQTEAGKEKRPRAHGQTENGEKTKKRAECWAHRNGQKARNQTHGQIETGKGHWRKLVTTY